MKKALSLILAALLLASSLVSCGNGSTTPNETEGTTDKVETNAPETEKVETNAPETTSPAPSYNTNLVTENGKAMAHIVLAEGTDQLLTFAAEELVYHIKTVSNADISVFNAVQKVSLPIIICTPDSLPELETMFPEDLSWLRNLHDEEGKRWANDGFAIRKTNDALYIFGATPRGALNGVHDFIEENMGVLWIRSYDDIGLVYDEMPTITLTKADYREKSPFQYRGTSFGYGFSEEAQYGTKVFYARNKLNTINGGGTFSKTDGVWNLTTNWILENDHLGHCLKYWLYTSPIYDPNCTEYWNVDEFGEPKPDGITQINFWSEKALDTVVAAILELLGQHPELKSVPLAIEDGLLEKSHCYNPPYSEQPFEYAPGQFVDPGDKRFHSTVVFTFVNNVAKRVAAEFPDVKVMTYAYHNAEVAPLCEIEPNVRVVFCPISECMTDNIQDPSNPYSRQNYNIAEEWRAFTEKGIEVGLYEYYFSYAALGDYERPIWYKLKADFQYFAECGFNGIVSEGSADIKEEGLHVWTNKPFSTMWEMSTLTGWLFSKLLWDPTEDVDALIEYFCDKVYGNASEYMKEYYSLIYKGWTEGEGDMIQWNYKINKDFYLEYFVYMVDLENDIKAALRNAYEAAENDVIKERIRYVKETYEANFPDEE